MTIPDYLRVPLMARALQLANLPNVSTVAENMLALEIIISHESTWNSRAINLTDINAKQGHPSQGLMQVIMPTFQEHAIAGFNTDITDPLSNMIAGIRYAVGRYGSLQKVPGVAAVMAGNAYCGY